MELIGYFFKLLMEYRILKTKCTIQILEVKKEFGFKEIDNKRLVLYFYFGTMAGSAIVWLVAYFIFNN